MNPKAALAVFVKTPGLSPVKTRLAKSVGTAMAERFFQESTRHLKKTLQALSTEWDCYWAVAEKEGLTLWEEFPPLCQGEGELGKRLASICSDLEHYAYVFLVGADSPMVTTAEFERALILLKEGSDFVVGPTFDGGFYLFGTRKKVPKEVWQSIPYSDNRTLACLEKALTPLGKLVKIKTLLDIDTGEDWERWKNEDPNHAIVLKLSKTT